MARVYYTSWIEEFVSHGFIVAAIDHPFAGHTRIEGRIVETQMHPDGPEGQTSDMAADLQFLLPLLTQRPGVDAKRVAAVGHSIGGAAALQACHLEPRITGCVNLDGAAFGSFAKTGVGQPFLVIHQKPVFEHVQPDGELARLGREIEKEWQDIIAKQDAPVLRLSVRGTGHLSFSDALFTRPELVADGGGRLADPLDVLRQTTAVIREFLSNAFSGTPGREIAMPDLVSPARMGQVD
jgi:pimeloyl-ACP methyl ester carboxylesterase